MKLVIENNKVTIAVWTVLLYLSAPFVKCFVLLDNLEKGVYPVNADSIGLGLFFFLVGWVLFMPFYLGFVAWSLHGMPAEISLFGMNRERKLWSWFWTILFALLTYLFLIDAFVFLRELNIPPFLLSFGSVVSLLIFRAITVFRRTDLYSSSETAEDV